jgi:hypothetical protein
MFNNRLFLAFAGQTLVPTSTGTRLYRDFVNDKQLNGPISNYRIGSDISFVRNSYATYFDSLCTLKVATTNEPRFDYNPDGTYQGLLIEDQTTNLIEYSQDFTQVWEPLLSGVTLTPNVPGISAIDNTETVTLLQPTTAFDFHALTWSATPAPLIGDPNPIIDSYDRSIFVKKETARYIIISCSAQLSAPAGGEPNFEQVANIFDFDLPGFTELSIPVTHYQELKDGWFRIGLTRNSTNFNTNRFAIGISSGPAFTDTKFAGDPESLSGVYIWGAQAEKGYYPTSYIPTNGAQVTRAGDNAFIDGRRFTLFFNTSAGSYSTVASRKGTDSARSFASFINVDSSKYITLGTDISGLSHVFTITNTQNLSTIETGPNNANQFYKLTVGYQNDDAVLYQDGVFIGDLTQGTLPQPPFGLNKFVIGQFNNSNYLNGHIRVLDYYPERLTNQSLSAL